ncbi:MULTISPECIES: NTP transferase domain-containing protein [Micromonospora]|uniref:nucleotidyltransferase family protein n=1 Tax=Micromonospora TaxID=1873 RepID=UPI001AE5AB36|nr:nucleotidyltransferase family protein [Micromonospora sp. C41]MBQ1062587.1 nucleotidyltransferase family protein [Micromonospora sp. C41]MDH6470797.1 molybdenum cofactor cytidylyltransferase [Micromonospora sp. H404/HB375]
MFVTGLVLAAGASVRLGEAKQLLPYRGRTLLDATLDLARSCAFDQLLVTLGGAADLVRERVDLTGVRVVENAEFSTGCGSSVRAAAQAVDPRADGLVLLLGDQPGVRAADVRRVVAATTPLAVCRYADGLGHPFWFARDVLPELRVLHGDKAVWKLLHSGRYPVTEIPVDGPAPIDVDTRADYRRLLSGEAR